MAEEVLVKSKETYYRGKPISYLKTLSVRESAQFLPSRSRRSVLRHFEILERFIQRCEQTSSQNKKIRTHLRDLVVVPKLVGFTIGVYNGKTFNDVHLSAGMIGHRLGEFSLTRSKVTHGTAGIGATKGSKTEKK
ncbi:ribosomal protein S19 family protein [Candidatus Pacearchaeota archaeon]|nr:30S ribosomal protein S19 [uncultured archaeon]MBS3089437.1 ribosomal protein S19 family protein [Candidatus Pacearchaeota archaeon]